jgi:predicted TPR repeat methyltransferase
MRWVVVQERIREARERPLYYSRRLVDLGLGGGLTGEDGWASDEMAPGEEGEKMARKGERGGGGWGEAHRCGGP